MKALGKFGWAAALCLLGCGRSQESGRAREQAHEHDEHDSAESAPDGGVQLVRVAREMMRDLRVTTRAAELRPAGDSVTVLGELRVNEEAYAEIGTSLPARVSRVLAAPGDMVTIGQALVELDSPEVGRARALLLTTRASLELAQKSVERRRALAAEQIVAARDLQMAEAELAQAQAEHRAAQEGLSALGATRGSGARFTLASPIAGTVIERSALLGRMVDAQQALFVVGDLSRLWLVVHAFERDALRMRVGALTQVNFPALPGEKVVGKLTRVSSRVDPASRTVDVRIELDNPSAVMRPGMSASASVPIGDSSEALVTVPIEAVQRQPGGWCVFVPRAEEGVFEMRPIGRGRDVAGEVEVVSGIVAGEKIVVEGAFLLRAEAEKARGGGEHHHH